MAPSIRSSDYDLDKKFVVDTCSVEPRYVVDPRVT
jgi:hypothetical protein